jgi:Lipid A 3-O-deacylase (PagL)
MSRSQESATVRSVVRSMAAALVAGFIFPIGATLLADAQIPQESATTTKWDLGIWTAGATGEEHTNSLTEAQIWTAGFSLGRRITPEIGSGWRRGSLEYAFDVIPLFVTSGSQRIHGGGFDPVLLRWNSSLHRGRVAPYIELGGGGVATSANLPSGNTSSFNFMAKGGGGVRLFTRNRQSLDVGLAWWHISNANLGVQNPEFNGLQLTVSYHWFK